MRSRRRVTFGIGLLLATLIATFWTVVELHWQLDRLLTLVVITLSVAIATTVMIRRGYLR